MLETPQSFLFLSYPASGHTNPQLPLVTELVSRGHKVTYICGEEFKNAIEKTGATWVHGGQVIPPHNVNDPDFDLINFLQEHLIINANATLEVFDSQLTDQHFDVIAAAFSSTLG